MEALLRRLLQLGTRCIRVKSLQRMLVNSVCFIVCLPALTTFYFNLQKVFGNHVLNRHQKVLPNPAFYSIQNVVFKLCV